jgi:cysteine desulfurase/selenocysteine lyase
MNHRDDFPLFKNRPELIYFDNGATAQHPQAVLDAEQKFYTTSNSNIHRGPNFLAEEATIQYEDSRRKLADFLGARHPHEIIFTKNATEAINLVARTFGETLNAQDVILLSKLEHHSNIVPWLQLAERKDLELKWMGLSTDWRVRLDPALFDERVKLVAVTGMSNVLGTITDLRPIIKAAHAVGAKVLVDASQLAVHEPINVHDLDADFLVVTGHKLYGPTGVGVLYGKEELLNSLPPFMGGGDMISAVFTDHFIPAGLPQKFEAGTPNIAGIIGLGAAIDYMTKLGFKKIQKLESDLTDHLLKKLTNLPYIKIIGPETLDHRGSVISFTMEGVHPHDVAEGLSSKGICIRAGNHCAQPLMDQLKISGTARMSLSFYNTKEEIDKAIGALEEVYKYFN